MAQTIAEIEDRSVISPMMQKYLETKEEYKDCILFYRLGDFYEMFFEDSLIAARELEIALTGKDCGLPERAPMAGIPHHAAEVDAEKLIEKGYKVAICEQLEDPKTAKGSVKRGGIRILTPGTIVESQIAENNQKYIGTIQKVLGEGPSKNNPDLLTGRTDSNKVVIFEGSKELIDTIIDLKIISEHMWYLKGQII